MEDVQLIISKNVRLLRDQKKLSLEKMAINWCQQNHDWTN